MGLESSWSIQMHNLRYEDVI